MYQDATTSRLAYRQDIGPLLGFYTQVFVGREQELAKLILGASERESTYVLVEAPAGYGKSALMAQLISRHDSGRWTAQVVPQLVYFFIREDGHRNSPEAFCLAVNSQLLELLGLPGGVPTSLEQQRTQLVNLWATAVTKASAERPLLMLVNGLDEMATVGGASIAELLPAALGPHVHVVVTSRPNPEPLAQVGPEHPLRQANVVRLHTLTLADVRELLVQQGMMVEQVDGLPERVLAVTRGEPLLARFVGADVTAGGQGVLADLEHNPPSGVKDYFRRQFRQLDTRVSGDMAWEALGLLLVAHGPITIEEIASALNSPIRLMRRSLDPTAGLPAPPSLAAVASSARLRLGHGGLDPGGPERHPGPVGHRPGLGDQPRHLDRVALADPRTGHAGHLDGDDLGRPIGT